jgi:hypothetical protein
MSNLHVQHGGQNRKDHKDHQQPSCHDWCIGPAGNNSLLMPFPELLGRATNPSGHTNSSNHACPVFKDEYHQRSRFYMTKWRWIEGPDFTKNERLL